MRVTTLGIAKFQADLRRLGEEQRKVMVKVMREQTRRLCGALGAQVSGATLHRRSNRLFNSLQQKVSITPDAVIGTVWFSGRNKESHAYLLGVYGNQVRGSWPVRGYVRPGGKRSKSYVRKRALWMYKPIIGPTWNLMKDSIYTAIRAALGY